MRFLLRGVLPMAKQYMFSNMHQVAEETGGNFSFRLLVVSNIVLQLQKHCASMLSPGLIEVCQQRSWEAAIKFWEVCSTYRLRFCWHLLAAVTVMNYSPGAHRNCVLSSLQPARTNLIDDQRNLGRIVSDVLRTDMNMLYLANF